MTEEVTEAETVDEGTIMCAFNDGNKAKHSLTVQTQGVLYVCTPCRKLLLAKDKSKRCVYCGVPHTNDWKKTALEGFKHVPSCPRSSEEVIEIG